MSASQPAYFHLQEFSDFGVLLVGGRLYTYAQGTTIHKTAYTDPAGLVPHTYTADGIGGQYIALNGRGELPVPMYLTIGAYDIALKRADGSTVWTRRAEPTVDGAPTGASMVGASDNAGGVTFTTVAGFISKILSSEGASLLGFIQAGIGAILRTARDKLREQVSVMDFGAKGDGTTDDTAAIRKAKDAASLTGRALFFPAPPIEYLITSTIDITEFCPLIGESAGLLSQYLGRQKGASRIKYTGTGPCFYVKPNPTPGTATRLPYGQQIKHLIIEGTATASHAVKVSDAANINVVGMDLAGLQIDNLFVYNFKAGRGLEINFCFNNSIKNYVAETCGVAATLRFAHNTTFTGGSLEQCLVGLDAVSTLDINLHGTCMQGCDISRVASQGLSMPANFFIWAGAWDGTGTSGVVRNTAAHYAGIGCRNFGSVVRWFGGYEEGNTIGYLTELDSDTAIYGKYVDLDAPVFYFAQFGIGAFSARDIHFQQGDKANLVGVFHTERNYAAPISIDKPTFPSTLPIGKKFTGPQTHVGQVDNFVVSSFRILRTLYRTDLSVLGTITHKGFRDAGGYNLEYRETLAGPVSGTVTVDFAINTESLNLVQVVDAADLTVTFSDAVRKTAGAPFRILIANTSATTPATIRFSSTAFGPGSPAYALGARKQRIFKFFFDNGFFLEEGVELPL